MNFNNNYNNFQRPNNNGIIWVQGIEGAKAFQLMPNSNAMLMDSENDGKFYIKTSDNIGMCNLRSFEYKEVTGLTKEPELNNYITKEEFNQAMSKLEKEIKHGKQAVSTNAEQLKLPI